MNITQVRRVVFRKKNGNSWSVFTMEADDLGQDTIMSVNISPRLRARNSSMGSTETPIRGTLGAFAGSVTFLEDTFEKLGKAIDNWKASTYTGHSATAGHRRHLAERSCDRNTKCHQHGSSACNGECRRS